MAELVVGIDTSEKLPDGYTRLEYIESTGTQYIDTNYIFPSTGDVEINGQFMYVGQQVNKSVFGCQRYGDTISPLFWIKENGKLCFYVGKSLDVVDDIPFNYDTVNTFHIKTTGSNYELQFNNNLYSGTFTQGWPSQWSFALFGNHYDNPWQGQAQDDPIFTQLSTAKLYSFKMKVDGNIVMDFVPAKRNSDNAVGMYDMVSGTFYINAGSGTFTAGPEYAPNVQYARVPALVVEKSQQRKYQLLDRVVDDSNNEIGTVSGFFTKKVEGHNLPDTYQELEYIELNHAYIDTGIVLDTAEKINTAKIHFTAANLPLSSGNTFAESGHSNHLFGCNEEIDGVNYDLEFFTGGDSSGEYCYGIRYGTTVANQWMINYPRNSQDFNPNIIPRFLNKYRFDIDNLQMSITDVNTGTVLGTDTASSVSFGFTNELRINGQNRYPSTDPWYAESYNIARIYDLEIEGIAHMVPAKRNSDNVVGMYDIIRDQFYTQTSTTGYSTAAIEGPYVIPDNMEYAVVCLDSTNRATGQSLFNNYTTKMVGIPTLSLTDNTDTIYSLSQTATENTNAILATATSTGSTSAVANYVRSKSFVIDGNTYYGQIPNAVELLDIYTNRSAINSLDSSGNINNSYSCHSSTQIICGGSGSIVGRYSHVFILPWGGLNGNWWDNTATTLNSASIYTIPVLEIPNIIIG